MPTYDYLCNACDYRFEELQSFSEPALTVCPQCQQKALTRLFGGGGAIIFKGSGFYETDYRKESYKKAAEAEAKAAEADIKSTSENTTTTASATQSKDSAKPGKATSATN